MDTVRGYILVGTSVSLDTALGTEDDTTVRCLSYLIKQFNQIPDLPIPENVDFEIIKAQYVGDPYPSIGMFSVGITQSDAQLTDVSFVMGRVLDQWINEFGLANLVAASAHETLTWQDILNGKRK